jgi:hypothetical protein
VEIKYFKGADASIRRLPDSQLYGCYVYSHAHNYAVCQAFGRDPEEAKEWALRIIEALKSTKPAPAPEPVHEGVYLAYDEYYDTCERANRTPLPFDAWKEQQS